MKPATEVLLSAAFALTPEENWTKKAFARNASGASVAPSDESACAWCVDGALLAASTGRNAAYFAAYNLLCELFPEGPIYFNDYHTHGEVLAALYKAAELAEGCDER